MSARKELERTFRRKKLKLGVVEERDSDNNGAEEKGLAGSVVHIHGVERHVLFDTAATPNVLSPRAVKKLSLSLEGTSKVVSVVTGAKSGAIGKIAGLPVFFDDLQAENDFIVLQNVPFYIIIRSQTVKNLGGVWDFRLKCCA